MNTTNSLTLPDTIIAADWSVDPRKRWRSTITHDGSGWTLHPAERVGANLLRDAIADSGVRTLVGFDFPIGMPMAYAKCAGVDCFRTLLAGVGRAPPWDRFWESVPPNEMPSVHRPVYPARNGLKGTVKKATLALGLGVESVDLLRRRIDIEQNAECIFWSLGAKQVAKGCFSGWREELQPALGTVRLWPFDGDLPELLRDPGVTVAEIYPAAAMRRIGVSLNGRKSDPNARRLASRALLCAIEHNSCATDRDAHSQIVAGFAAENDDAFDACIAAVALLDVVNRYAPSDEPPVGVARQTEGWILGVR